MRLRRSRPEKAGWSRRRRGRGFSYTDEAGAPLSAEQVQRCRELAIPPAWTDVWICPWPNGHIQAVGRDAAGRLQYLYHPLWRERRDAAKFEHVLAFGAALPAARVLVAEHLALPGMPEERALAAGFRILDRGAIRIGGEEYARTSGSVGVATLRRDQTATSGDRVTMRFTGKSGRDHVVELDDAALADAVRVLMRRRTGGRELLAWQVDGSWTDVHTEDINRYIRSVTGCDATAKDFRTWHANVVALAALADAPIPASARQRTRSLTQATAAVADDLGNTVAVARRSYLDPRLSERFMRGALDPQLDAEMDVARCERLLLEILA